MDNFAPENRKALLDVFAQIGDSFACVKKSVNERENAIRKALDAVAQAQARNPWQQSELAEKHPLKKLTEESLLRLQQVIKEWLDDVEAYDARTEFRQHYGDSLLIYIFGKVKAGKSSLGNYIAYGTHKPGADVINHASPQPRFFVHVDTGASEAMTAEKMANQRHFSIGVSETTSAIQGFTLPGLTWVDSPGIHSVTGVNGELAENYADCADLVIFLSSSTSPGRKTDISSIGQFLKKETAIMVLITSSDFLDDDEVDGELVTRWLMKPDVDRAEQVDYVSREIAGLEKHAGVSSKQTEIISVSTLYAQDGDGSADDEKRRWQASGMADFSRAVAGVARTRGLAIKRAVPLKNLLSFCEKLAHSSRILDDALMDIARGLEEARRDLRLACGQAINDMTRKLSLDIERLAEKHAMNDRAFAEACQQSYQRALQQTAERLHQQMKKGAETLAARTRTLDTQYDELPGFSSRKEKVTYTSRFYENAGKAGGAGLGAVLGSIAGSLLLPGIGTAVGGVIGGAAGGYAGQKAGEYFTEEKNIDVIVGDNRQEVALKARELLIERARKQTEEYCQQVDQRCFSDIHQWLQQVSHALAHLRNELTQQSASIKKELSDDHA